MDPRRELILNRVENLDSLSKLESLGFEGSDVSLETSLFEYDLAWKELGDGEWLFVHLHSNCSNMDENKLFDSTILREDYIDYFTDLPFSSLLSFVGMTEEDWKKLPFYHKISDLVSHSGIDNVFGESYGGFKIHKLGEVEEIRNDILETIESYPTDEGPKPFKGIDEDARDFSMTDIEENTIRLVQNGKTFLIKVEEIDM